MDTEPSHPGPIKCEQMSLGNIVEQLTHSVRPWYPQRSLEENMLLCTPMKVHAQYADIIKHKQKHTPTLIDMFTQAHIPGHSHISTCLDITQLHLSNIHIKHRHKHTITRTLTNTNTKGHHNLLPKKPIWTQVFRDGRTWNRFTTPTVGDMRQAVAVPVWYRHMKAPEVKEAS